MPDLITPIVEIRKNLFAKYEFMNPSGSHKVRAARWIIEDAIQTGKIIPGKTTVIEKTGGNFGFALVSLAKKYKLNVELAIGLSFSQEKRSYLGQMGANLIGVELLKQGLTPKEVIHHYLDNAESENKQYFYTDQFTNNGSYQGHLNVTGPEIIWAIMQLNL